LARCNIRAVTKKTLRTEPRPRTMDEPLAHSEFSPLAAHALRACAASRHHGATGGFPADGVKRRRIAFSDWHAQGCAPSMFVTEKV
jgi:hypothetical protein